jgi:hypothetical protein
VLRCLPLPAVLCCAVLSTPADCTCRSIPAFNPQVGTIQRTLEDIAFLLRIPQRKPWGNMGADVAVILKTFDDREQLLAGV